MLVTAWCCICDLIVCMAWGWFGVRGVEQACSVWALLDTGITDLAGVYYGFKIPISYRTIPQNMIESKPR